MVVADLYSVVARGVGPVDTFITLEDAERTMNAMVRDEPEW